MTHNSTPADELAPCPCCNTDAVFLPHAMRTAIRYRVKCTNDGCGLTTNTFGTEAEALAAWSTRQPPSGAIRNAVIEECAKVAENHTTVMAARSGAHAARLVAKAIRALAQDNHTKGQDNAG